MKTQFRKLVFALALAAGTCTSLTNRLVAHDLPADRFACPFVDFDSESTGPAAWQGNAIAQPAGAVNRENSFGLASIESMANNLTVHVQKLAHRIQAQWHQLNQLFSHRDVSQSEAEEYSDPCQLERDSLADWRVAAPALGLPPAPPATATWSTFEDHGNPFVIVGESSSEELDRIVRVAPPDPGSPPQPILLESDQPTEQPCLVPGYYVSLFGRAAAFQQHQVEEYAPYDLEPRDTHWLAGIGHPWNWNSPVAVPLSKYWPSRSIEVESFDRNPVGAFQRDPNLCCEEELAIAVPVAQQLAPQCLAEVSRDWTCPEELYYSVVTDFEAHADESVAPLSSNMQGLLVLGQTCEWLEDAACAWQNETCDFRIMHEAGEHLASLASHTRRISERSFQQLVSVVGHDDTHLPTGILFPMFAMYSTGDGVSVIVPADLAHQWCADVNASSHDVPTTHNAVTKTVGRGTHWVVAQSIGWLDWTHDRFNQVVEVLSQLQETQVAHKASPSVR